MKQEFVAALKGITVQGLVSSSTWNEAVSIGNFTSSFEAEVKLNKKGAPYIMIEDPRDASGKTKLYTPFVKSGRAAAIAVANTVVSVQVAAATLNESDESDWVKEQIATTGGVFPVAKLA